MTPSPAPVSADAVPFPIRYLDCVLVLAFVPFALLAGLPVAGTLVGAGAWIGQRALGTLIEARAARTADARTATAIAFAGVIGRPFLLGITILAVGLAGARRDGLTAAVLVLVAFTVYLVLSIVLRPQRKSST